MSKEIWKDQEAYDVVFNHFDNCTCQEDKFLVHSALNHIYKVIKRNEPMKPQTKTYTNGYFKRLACSICDTTIQKEFAYCPCCGQKLDWSDENE